EHCAPIDTHDITTKPSPQLMVLRHGALSGFCPIIILMKRLNAFVVGWRVGVGAPRYQREVLSACSFIAPLPSSLALTFHPPLMHFQGGLNASEGAV
ncbi:hypothetical protein KUCAC02_019203, partial [Chaenocephalus aceratus]